MVVNEELIARMALSPAPITLYSAGVRELGTIDRVATNGPAVRF